MGIFSRLSIARVKSKLRKTVLIDEQAIRDIEQLKKHLDDLVLQKDDASGFLKPLSFARRQDRKIGIVVVDDDFFRSNLSRDEHITLFDSNVHVS